MADNHVSETPHQTLEPQEKRDARRREAPSAAVVFEAIRRAGEVELRRPLGGLAWSALAAGLSMGFSFVAEALLYTYTPEYAWRPIVASLGYSVGFLFVILGRQQLFTENTLTPILELMRRKRWRTFWRTAELWAVVLTANMVGVTLFAAAVVHTDLVEPEVREAFTTLATREYGVPFGNALVRAVFAGWLIALMVWLLPFAETARVSVIVIVSYVIGLAGFFHIIAGSVAALYAVLAGLQPIGAFLTEFFLPVLLGNILGGVALVAAINYAQVNATAGARDADPA